MNIQCRSVPGRPATSALRLLWSFIRQHWLVAALVLITIISSCWLMTAFGKTDILILHVVFMGIITSCFVGRSAATKSEPAPMLKPQGAGEFRSESRADRVAVAVIS
jgi:hypothetical protein